MLRGAAKRGKTRSMRELRGGAKAGGEREEKCVQSRNEAGATDAACEIESIQTRRRQMRGELELEGPRTRLRGTGAGSQPLRATDASAVRPAFCRYVFVIEPAEDGLVRIETLVKGKHYFWRDFFSAHVYHIATFRSSHTFRC